MTTDLPLLYAPSLIALGALLKVALSNPNNEKTVQDYIQNVTARQATSPEELQVLMANVTAVADFLKVNLIISTFFLMFVLGNATTASCYRSSTRN